jgi:hypothetical protein
LIIVCKKLLQQETEKLLEEALIMNQPLNLTLEQEFNQRLFADQVQHLSREEAQEMLIILHEHMMLKDNVYKMLISDNWEINPDATDN